MEQTNIIRCVKDAAVLFAAGHWRIMGFVDVGPPEARGWTLTSPEFDTPEDALEYFEREFIET